MRAQSDQPSGLQWIVLVVLFGGVLLSRLSPGPGPVTPPKPSQVCLLIVEDTASRTPEVATILTSRQLREWLSSRGHLLRVVDPDSVAPDGSPAKVLGPYRAWRSAAGNQSVTLPVGLLVLSDGSVYRGGPLPDSVDAVVEWVRANTAAASDGK